MDVLVDKLSHTHANRRRAEDRQTDRQCVSVLKVASQD